MNIDPCRVFTGTLLITAPHMDDEVLACGGTIGCLPRKDRIHVVYATDGARSPVPASLRGGKAAPELVPVRTAEARQAMAVLGIPEENIHFLGLPDGTLGRNPQCLSHKLEELIRSIRPDHILGPFRYDRHPDHVALHRAVLEAAVKSGGLPELFEYFVYYRYRLLPGGDIRNLVRPGMLIGVNTKAKAAQKRKALSRYSSQTTLYYPWQRRPILPGKRLDEVCNQREVFLRFRADYPGPAVFYKSNRWIRLLHFMEPRLKQVKEVIGALVHLRSNTHAGLRVHPGLPIRVVVFSGGPSLEGSARQFLCRIEDHPEIDLLACIVQSQGQSRCAVAVDLWRRRGLLALPMLALRYLSSAWQVVRNPVRGPARVEIPAALSGRIHYVTDIHAAHVLHMVKRLAPDLGLIYGSPVLKPALFNIPALGTLGIHHGKVPEYRGKKTMFWAIYNGEKTTGVTIQKVNAGLDAGEIVMQGEVPIGHSRPAAVWKELNALGLDLYIRAILEVKRGTARYRPQDGQKGKLYRDPKAADILELWRRIIVRAVRARIHATPRPSPLRPKVCILTETYHPVVGGGETQARLLAKGLVNEGCAVIVLTRRSSLSLPKVERFCGVTVYRLPPAGGQHLNKWGLLLSSFPALFRLRRQYDLVFVSGFRVVGISAVMASRLLGKICILKADNNGEMSGEFFRGGMEKLGWNLDSFLFKGLLRLRNQILSSAHCFVAISSRIAQEYAAHGVTPSSRISFIPNSVDTRVFRPVSANEKIRLRKLHGLPPNAVLVVYAGRLVSYKGLFALLEAWKELCAKCVNIGLVLVGSGSMDIYNCEVELRRYVGANHLEGSIYFCGEVHNVHEYLQACDLFALPTEREAFGISVIEAMACGLPVIATGVGGLKDFLVHGKNGWVVRPGEKDELLHAMEHLTRNRDLCRSLGKSAYRTAGDRFRADIVTGRYLDLFKDQLAGCSNQLLSRAPIPASFQS